MPWYARAIFLIFGFYIIWVEKTELAAGHFVYLNHTYREPIFAPGVMALGCLFLLLAFLPSGNWIYRRISTLKNDKLLEAGSSRKTRRLIAGRRRMKSRSG